ncbi:MAG: Lrp/AsnC family transcriptional regulator [Desulfovibrio sp.]|nr:Lrp/AsnC family transcriptional regulator [Desulfovibrio sp.]
MPPAFSAAERAALAIVQGNIPDSLTPYADIAARTGLTEAEVLALLTRLKESGAIRRFGASIRHQRTGWTHNAMVAWIASEEEARACGPIAATHPRVSHAYYRPSRAADWPYTLYTMAHGRSEAECLGVVDDLLAAWPLREYAILRSLKELKKTSMTYFA